VAETIAFRLTAFDVVGGGLSNRRVWAALGARPADGIALDAEGCIWAANPLAAECFRVDGAGRVLDVVETDARCFGCALGGEDGRTLFVSGADHDDEQDASMPRTGRIWTARVMVPAA
jgi:sugar lactone lactonase YvrE